MKEEKKQDQDSLKDYIRWRGDLAFSERPFNLVDNLILSELSYLDFSPALKPMSPAGINLQECWRIIQEKDAYRLLTAEGGQEEFVAMAASSRRFGSIRPSFYREILDPSQTQFAAIHFEIDPDTEYIAFRGTDGSIIGWKEDFMISFRKIPAQEEALDYVRSTMQAGKKYYIGGHSKGGNLAVYTAAYLSEEERSRVIRVFMNDGPGFCQEVFDLNKIRSIYPMVTRILPSYDVIGQLFADEIEDTIIVSSSNKGILQHDLISWQTNGPHLSKLSELDRACDFTNATFRQWIESMSSEKREAFVNGFFDSLAAGGAETMDEITAKGTKGLIEVFRAMSKTSADAREAALALPVSAVSTAAEMVQNHMKNLQASFIEKKAEEQS